MKKVSGKAYAKINLSLDVKGLQSDGFHTIRTVMQQISLCDDICLTENAGQSTEVRFFSNLRYLPTDDRNNAVKAAKLFYAAAGTDGVLLDIKAVKRIPVAGGLGGSSTDAACVLNLLSQMHPGAVDRQTLYEIASKVGSDVPFFLTGGCALAEGTGRTLTRLKCMPDVKIVVAKCGKGLSAGSIYRHFDENPPKMRETTGEMLSAIESESVDGICAAVSNMLMPAASEKEKSIGMLCEVMALCKAKACCMTGSGSAVFGIFESQGAAEACKKEIEKKYPRAKVFIASPVSD